jgi:hypothetical protein
VLLSRCTKSLNYACLFSRRSVHLNPGEGFDFRDSSSATNS